MTKTTTHEMIGCSSLTVEWELRFTALSNIVVLVAVVVAIVVVVVYWGPKQRLEALIRRAVRVGLYPTDGPSLHQLVADVDDTLFARIQANQHHVLQELLPLRTCHKYGLRSRRHNYTLNIKTDYDDRNFITRLLHKDSRLILLCISCGLTTFIKRR